MMRSGGAAVAAVASAVTAAASYTTAIAESIHQTKPHIQEGGSENKLRQQSSQVDRFAPRFDGLRFVETLVTAHR